MYKLTNKAIDYRTCQVFLALHTQASDIAQKVHEHKSDEDIGAGDQVEERALQTFV